VTGEVRERSGAPAIATEPHRGHESRRLLLGLMRLGVYVIPFLPLYVSTSLLFPSSDGTVVRMLNEKKGRAAR